MSALREAIVLPAIFLTVVLLAGLRPGQAPVFVPPSLFALVLGVLLIGALVRSGALAPERLLDSGRQPLANANGLTVLVTAYGASAQLLALVTPTSGLPLFFVSVFLFVLLLNTWVGGPDRTHALRSLMVIFGAAFVLKFVVLDAMSDPSGGRMKRMLLALFDAATFGNLAQQREHPAAGYLAFAAIALFLAGVAALPARRDSHSSTAMTVR